MSPPRRARPGGRKYLTAAELKRFIDAIDRPRDKALFYLMYAYGLRASEPAMMKLIDVDLEGEAIYIRRLKGSLCNSHRLEGDGIKVLRSYLKVRSEQFPKSDLLFPVSYAGEHGIGRQRIYRLMQHYGAKAKISPGLLFPHILKMTLGTKLNADGVPIMAIKHALGHKSVTSTQAYMHMTESEMNLLRKARSGLLR
jgi:site-specific recombinase XerD